MSTPSTPPSDPESKGKGRIALLSPRKRLPHRNSPLAKSLPERHEGQRRYSWPPALSTFNEIPQLFRSDVTGDDESQYSIFPPVSPSITDGWSTESVVASLEEKDTLSELEPGGTDLEQRVASITSPSFVSENAESTVAEKKAGFRYTIGKKWSEFVRKSQTRVPVVVKTAQNVKHKYQDRKKEEHKRDEIKKEGGGASPEATNPESPILPPPGTDTQTTKSSKPSSPPSVEQPKVCKTKEPPPSRNVADTDYGHELSDFHPHHDDEDSLTLYHDFLVRLEAMILADKSVEDAIREADHRSRLDPSGQLIIGQGMPLKRRGRAASGRNFVRREPSARLYDIGEETNSSQTERDAWAANLPKRKAPQLKMPAPKEQKNRRRKSTM